MITKQQLKYYSELTDRKHRYKEGKFLIEGVKVVLETLDSAFKIEKVFITHPFHQSNEEIVTLLQRANLNIEYLKTYELEKLSDTKNPQGIVAVVQIPQFDINKIDSKVIIALDRINDPGNLGTIIRTADWFGFNNILISKESVDAYNPKVIRGSMGSIYHTTIIQNLDLPKICTDLKKKGYKVVITDLKSTIEIENLKQKKEKTIIVFSNESEGPCNNMLQIADYVVTIKKYGLAESLNVAIAAGIILNKLRN